MSHLHFSLFCPTSLADEAHRGYILDREMGETETLYRDQRDFQSKYRAVISYFDAARIGLTATPALRTVDIFGAPVFQYTYGEAVVDGYLVDHDAPHRLPTKLSVNGIHYHAGDTVTLLNPKTNAVTDGAEVADELDFDVDNFNRNVINETLTARYWQKSHILDWYHLKKRCQEYLSMSFKSKEEKKRTLQNSNFMGGKRNGGDSTFTESES